MYAGLFEGKLKPIFLLYYFRGSSLILRSMQN